MTKLSKMIPIKTKAEIKLMAKSGQIACFALNQLIKHIRPGITTRELDRMAKRLIESRGATPAFLGHDGYPYTTCISINDEVVHGIPGEKIINEGDVVGIDLGARYEGYYSDTAATVSVGRASDDVKRLLKGTKEALETSLKAIKPGVKIGDVERAAGEVLRKYHLSPILSLCGHGIGKELHEEPSIKCDGVSGSGEQIEAGMVMAIEPMASLGKPEVYAKSDGWTVLTKDGSITAHFEHTVLVTSSGIRLLTSRC